MNEKSAGTSENETTDVLYDGVEQKRLFSDEEQATLFADVGTWFEGIKESIPKIGILICNRYDSPNLFTENVGTPPPESMIKLVNAMIEDAKKDPANANNNHAKITFERTGKKFSNPDDTRYHVDTKQIKWDENGNRLGYDNRSGPDKYLAFINRPGTLVVKRRLDPELTNPEQNAIASEYSIDPETGETTMIGSAEKPEVLQLSSGQIYKVQVGNLIHSAPVHEDGMLIAVSLLEEPTKNTPIPVYLTTQEAST